MTKKDSQSRKWMITINNPVEKGFDHERIKTELQGIKSLVYWCMCDEIGGKTSTHHTHIVLFRSGALRFSTLQKIFPPGSQIDNLKGTVQQARDYVRKEGKYKDTEKEETNLKDTFEEYGECPEEHQGQRTDLHVLYEMIKDGNSNYEILEHNPAYMNKLDTIDKVREMLRYEEFSHTRRLDLHVEYWFGAPGQGKTRGVLDRYGDGNVYVISDYRNPWDGYRGQDVVLFDDFDSSMYSINELLRWLDVYPIELRCRYNNKVACYTKVFFTSNTAFDMQYRYIQKEQPMTWEAYCRRFHCIKEFTKDGKLLQYQSIDEYLNAWRRQPKECPKDEFVQLTLDEAKQLDDMFGGLSQEKRG